MKRCLSCFKEYNDNFFACPHCGQDENIEAKSPIDLAPGTILDNRYILGKSVNSGGFGIIYKAYDTKLETIVAIKEYYVGRLGNRGNDKKTIVPNGKTIEEFKYRKERFKAEAKAMAKFGNHKNIPNVFEVFEENNSIYIVMEFLDGVDLSAYLKQNNYQIDINFAIHIVNEVCGALKSLHKEGIVHRDVAPDNIFICKGKEIKIKNLDLGAAMLQDETDDIVDIVIKNGYTPVEQYEKDKKLLGPWTDIYALGATLYVMLTGVKPEESTNRKINDDVLDPIALNPNLSQNLSNTIMKAMAVEKHMRFKNIDEFLKALNGEKKVLDRKGEKRKKVLKRAATASIACILVALLGVSVFSVYYSKKNFDVLKPATIDVWYSVSDGLNEKKAMIEIQDDFKKNFPDVTINLEAIPENEYMNRLEDAFETDSLPTLFESTGVSDEILNKAIDLNNVIKSNQFQNNAYFLKDYYSNYYPDSKQMPLGIEVPLAFVIVDGPQYIKYSNDFFIGLEDFKYDDIVGDKDAADLIARNFGEVISFNEELFMNSKKNKSAVMISSTMAINEVKDKLKLYEKKYVYPETEEIFCNFVYEWSITGGSRHEIRAAEKLLTWMLDESYQKALMLEFCSDGQIPVNSEAFANKITISSLKPINDIYDSFVFMR